jgi:hypothetical protein
MVTIKLKRNTDRSVDEARNLYKQETKLILLGNSCSVCSFLRTFSIVSILYGNPVTRGRKFSGVVCGRLRILKGKRRDCLRF